MVRLPTNKDDESLFKMTRAEISRSRLIANFEQLRTLAGRTSGCGLLAVVKANAYGHGISFCAPWLVEAGAGWLGVTSVVEGAAVRRLCPEAKILVMCGLEPGDETDLLDARLTATVWDPRHLEILAGAAQRCGMTAGSVPVHLEIDTGMSRQGVGFEEPVLAKILERLRAVSALRLDGAFTHFASPEILDSNQSAEQMSRFAEAVRQISTAGLRPSYIHAGNSTTLLGGQQMDALAGLANSIGVGLLVRPGLALYGYAQSFTGGCPQPNRSVALQPVLAWKTILTSLRNVRAGTRVGYDGTFTAPSEMKLGLLPVGYADGLNRKLSNRGYVLVRGEIAPIVGRISMDLTVVDLSGIPGAVAGDEVVILGRQGSRCITADDHARWAETISYEILCAIGARVLRVAVG